MPEKYVNYKLMFDSMRLLFMWITQNIMVTAWSGADKSTSCAEVGSGSNAWADLLARALRAVYRVAGDHFRDNKGKSFLLNPPTLVLRDMPCE